MSALICVTPDNVETVLSDLPRIVRLAFGFGSRLRRGTLDVTLPDGRQLRLGGVEPGPSPALTIYGYGFAPPPPHRGAIGLPPTSLPRQRGTPGPTQIPY